MKVQRVQKRASGEDHLVSKPSVLFLSDFYLVQDLPTGYQGTNGRATRCTDRFVRYPYPKNVFSNYKQNYRDTYKQTVIKNHKEAFNLEKESKIINPHKMELQTTNKATFRGTKGKAA